jgi:hypothetical protein
MMAARTVNGLPPALDDTCKSLYVGNLDPRVTDMMLGDIFRTMGEVTHVKIIPDKNVIILAFTESPGKAMDFWRKILANSLMMPSFRVMELPSKILQEGSINTGD